MSLETALAAIRAVRDDLAAGAPLSGARWRMLDLIMVTARGIVHQAGAMRVGGRGSSGKRRQVLTHRERQVLELAAHGLRRTQIADALGLSKRTVDMHLTHAAGKLDLVGAPAAAVAARAQGLGLLVTL